MEPVPQVQTARDIAKALGRDPNEKGVDRLAADLAEAIALDGAPTCTEANLRTIKACVRHFDEDGLAEYINLLMGIAYVRGQRAEIEARIEVMSVPDHTAPLDFRDDGEATKGTLTVDACPKCGAVKTVWGGEADQAGNEYRCCISSKCDWSERRPLVATCPHCKSVLTSVAEGCALTCPHGCTASEHHHTIEHREEPEAFDTSNEL